MRHQLIAIAVFILVVAAPPARAGDGAPVSIVTGESWDGPGQGLQDLINYAYGPGFLESGLDYIGARIGDLDPWFWVDNEFSAFLVKEVAGNANRNILGWYLETGSAPVIDGINDGVIFDGPSGAGATAVIMFSHPMTKFGFYLNPNGTSGATNAPEPELFFTNRFYNDEGPDGSGAIHAPSGGDMQALVYDISAFTQPNTWLVCFEDVDSGANPGEMGASDTDNDFNDFIFEVTAFGATPTRPMTFGALKEKYRH
jgi:hypothetical protein